MDAAQSKQSTRAKFLKKLRYKLLEQLRLFAEQQQDKLFEEQLKV